MQHDTPPERPSALLMKRNHLCSGSPICAGCEVEGVVGLICAIYAWRERHLREFAATLSVDFAVVSVAHRRMRQATREHLAELAERQSISPEGLALLIRTHTGLD